MKYSFKQFEFDCDKRILTENGIEVPLHEKASRLLVLFLTEADKLHTKSEILEHIWLDKVVSEQVIFQNISHLRALFGNDAIKTYIKKGYQWQLPFQEIVDTTTIVKDPNKTGVYTQETKAISSFSTSKMSAKSHHTDLTKTDKNPPKDNRRIILLSACFVTLLIFVSVNVIKNRPEIYSQHNTPLRALILLSSNSPDDTFKSSVTSQNKITTSFTIQNETQNISSQQLFDSPFSSWESLSDSVNDLAVATKTYQFSQGELLRFHIQGKNRGWQGYIHESADKAIEQLVELLIILSQTEFFSLESDNAALAELVLLQNQKPENFLINHQLITMHFQLGHYDLATALINQQLVSSPGQLNLGLLQRLKAKSTMENENWQDAETNINQALRTFNQLNLPQLTSLALLDVAWVHYVKRDHPASMRSLNQSATKAREANEPLQELQAHLLQAYLASKTKQLQLMHTQLDLARNLLKFHGLGEQHQIPIFSTLAWSERDKQNALPHYMAILEQPYAPLYKDRFYNSARHVREINIKAKQWQSALASIRPWQRPSFVALTHAHITFAQGNFEAGVEHGVAAFRQAQLDHQLHDALDAALLLLQHKTSIQQLSNVKEFSDYIKQNATHSWLDQNKTQLKQSFAIKGAFEL